MKIKDILKKKRFWVGVAALVAVVLQLCGIKVDTPIINELILGVCSLLVAVGFMSATERNEVKKEFDEKSDPQEKNVKKATDGESADKEESADDTNK